MPFTEISIVPKEFVTVKTISKIAIYVVRVDLFQKAEIHVNFLEDNGCSIDVKVLVMEGEDYSSWASDDQYVVDWVLTKLELSSSTQVVV
jgi:hypothetical protein